MEKFLDEKGLLEVWRKIKERSLPSKDVLKKDFVNMTDEEKKGFVVVTDENPSGSSQSLEVYSEEERVIGTWFGKPLYRIVYNLKTPSSNTTATTVGTTKKNIDTFVKVRGIINKTDGTWEEIPYYISDGSYIRLWINSSNIRIRIQSDGSAFNVPMIVILEYTKTTD